MWDTVRDSEPGTICLLNVAVGLSRRRSHACGTCEGIRRAQTQLLAGSALAHNDCVQCWQDAPSSVPHWAIHFSRAGSSAISTTYGGAAYRKRNQRAPAVASDPHQHAEHT